MKLALFALCALLAGCSLHNGDSRQSALPKASVFVERFGQIVSNKELNYVEYVQNRLASVLAKSSRKNKNYQIILLNTKIPIASYAGGQIIMISKGIVVSVQTEAEFAFILAHEMSHQHLGHDPDQENSQGLFMRTDSERLEIEADRLAVATLSAAGYDPRMSISALRHTYQYAAPYIIDTFGYPSLQKRESEIVNFLNSSGWAPPGTINRKEFNDFRNNLF